MSLSKKPNRRLLALSICGVIGFVFLVTAPLPIVYSAEKAVNLAVRDLKPFATHGDFRTKPFVSVPELFKPGADLPQVKQITLLHSHHFYQNDVVCGLGKTWWF